MTIYKHIEEVVKRDDERDSAFADSLFHLMDNPDKADEFRKKMRIEFESVDSALDAAIKAVKREMALNDMAAMNGVIYHCGRCSSGRCL